MAQHALDGFDDDPEERAAIQEWDGEEAQRPWGGVDGAGEHDDLVVAVALSLERERAAGLRTAIPS